jgi:hypothetical protein
MIAHFYGGAMHTRKPHDPYLSPDPIARVFSLDHARRDKEALLARDHDIERRHPARMLDAVNWTLLGALVYSLAVNVLAIVGAAWLIGRLIDSIEAGVWL